MDIDSLHDTRTLGYCEPIRAWSGQVDYPKLEREQGNSIQDRLARKYAMNPIMMAQQHKNKGPKIR